MSLPLIPILSVLLSTLAVAVAAYALYPRLEGYMSSNTGSYLDWIVAMNEKMFQPTERKRAALAILLSIVAAAALALFLVPNRGLVTLLAVIGAAGFGWAIPRIWVGLQWNRRIRELDRQLIDALNLLSSSLKSGLNLPQAIQVLVAEMPPPISQEFGLVLSQQKLGLTLDEALGKLSERLPSVDLTLVVNSVLILRETGGDLSETFSVIASTIRERRKVDGKIKSITQMARSQAIFLFIFPFAIGAVLYTVNPGYLDPLFKTIPGLILIGVIVFLQVIGGLWLRKIVSIDV